MGLAIITRYLTGQFSQCGSYMYFRMLIILTLLSVLAYIGFQLCVEFVYVILIGRKLSTIGSTLASANPQLIIKNYTCSVA